MDLAQARVAQVQRREEDEQLDAKQAQISEDIEEAGITVRAAGRAPVLGWEDSGECAFWRSALSLVLGEVLLLLGEDLPLTGINLWLMTAFKDEARSKESSGAARPRLRRLGAIVGAPSF